jgi:hypothetical protein
VRVASPADSAGSDYVHLSENAAVSPAATSQAALLAGRVLRDGEVVLLVLKPSPWMIVFNSLRLAGAALLVVLAAHFFRELPARSFHFYVEAAVFIVAGRVMWAVCQWMGRLYVLTDQRILRIAGVFNIEVFDCPLRKVAGTHVAYSLKERFCHVGSIEIHPRDESMPVGLWQTIRRPVEVNETIVAAINRAGS